MIFAPAEEKKQKICKNSGKGHKKQATQQKSQPKGTVFYMNRQSFLDALGSELARLGADDASIAAQKEKMDSYLRSKNMDEVDVDPRRMAEGIMQKIAADRKPVAENASAAANVKPEKPEETKPAGDPLSALGSKPRRTAVHINDEPDEAKSAAPHRLSVTAKAKTDEKQAVHRDTPHTATEKRPVKKEAADLPDPVTDPGYYDSAKPKTAADQSNKPLSRVLLCAAVPLGAVLCVAAVAVFLGLIFLLAAAAIGFVAALIAIVGVGCSVALIGIIYGAYKIVTGVVPVGLYEIGLGITVGSVASLIGILMYNIAIRLIPFLMKKLAELVGFGLRKARDGFVALKGALEKQ